MKNFILLAGLLIVLMDSVFGQPGYFNTYYDIVGPGVTARASTAIATDKGYLIAGYSEPGSYPTESNRILLFEVDSSGNILWSREHSRDSLFMITSECDIFQGADSSYGWFIAMYDTANWIFRPAYVSFDRQGNLLFTKIIYDPQFIENKNYNPGIATKTNDNGFLLCCYSESTKLNLFKLNAALDVEWKKELGFGSGSPYISNIIQLADSSYMMGYTAVFGNGFSFGFLMHLFKNGEVDWRTEFGGPPPTSYNHVIQDSDSTFIVVHSYTTQSSQWGQTLFARFEVSKVDAHGNIEWEKIIGDEKYNPSISKLMRLPDSTFVFFGSIGGLPESYMFRISAQGDSLIYKEFTNNNSTAFAALPGGLISPDNGLLFCGDIFFENQQGSYSNRPWLYKTDWYGCTSTGCDSTNVYITGCTPSRTICKGDSTWLTMNSIGAGTAYQWEGKVGTGWHALGNNSVFSGTTSDTLRILKSVVFGGDRTFRCKVQNQFWKLYSPEIPVYYFESPSITLQPVSLNVPVGSSASFVMNASGIEYPQFQWYFMGSAIIGATDKQLVIHNVTKADSGFYACKAWNSCGEMYTDTAWLKTYIEGIADDPAAKGIAVYPNPVSGMLNIKFNNRMTHKAECTIYNELGIASPAPVNMAFDGSFIIDFRNLPDGLYLLSITTLSHHYNLRIIKRR
jgi:hypothetical protein